MQVATFKGSTVAAEEAFVLSAPCNVDDYGRSIVDIDRFRPYQTLLGADAHLLGVSEMLRVGSREIVFSPNPENFNHKSLPSLFDEFSKRRGQTPSRIVHYRFGLPRDARILKGVDNWMLLLTTKARSALYFRDTPHARNDFLYDGFLAAKGPQGSDRYLSSPGGREISVEEVDWRFVYADLAAKERHKLRDGMIAPRYAHDLRLQGAAFSEYVGSQWQGRADQAHSFGLSRRFSSMLSRRTSGATRLVLLPIDLSDDGAVASALVSGIAKFGGLEQFGVSIAICPYNEFGGLDKLSALVASSAPSPDAANSLYLFRTLDLASLPFLRSLFDFAVVDCSNPDSGFVVRRLEHVGLKVLKIIPGHSVERLAFNEFECDCESVEDISDQYGRRAVVAPRMTSRRLAELLTFMKNFTGDGHAKI